MNAERPLIFEFKRTEIPATRYVVNCLREDMELDLSPLQCEVFIQLKENDGIITQKDLEKSLDVSKSTLSGVLKTMEKNGFIEKTVSENDKRVTIVTLTPDGDRAYSEAMKITAELDRIVFGGLDDEEAETLMRILGKVRSNIDSADSRHIS